MQVMGKKKMMNNPYANMKTKTFFLNLLMIIIVMFSISEIAGFCGSGDENFDRPFRVIVIIGDQWQDPMS